MDQVITYNKTYQERYLEYMDVLSGYEVLSVNDIKKEWSLFMDLTVDSSGWQAVWKIPRLKCEELKIGFPTVVLAYVEMVDYLEIEATVKVLAVQGDIHIPDRHSVPLIQLWPTKEQDKTVALNLELTSNTIDMYRFFYLNIFMPWDMQEDTSVDWLSKHLELRLHLYFDMRNGVIPKATAQHLKSLLNDAHRLHAQHQLLASQIDDDNADGNKEKDMDILFNIYLQILQIRNEVEILEDPTLRKAYFKNQMQTQTPNQVRTIPENFLVMAEGNVDDYTTFLFNAKGDIRNENLKFVSSIYSALENSNGNDKIILNRGEHTLGSSNSILCGGILKGLYSKEETIINSINDDIMLDCSNDVLLENVTFNVNATQYGIVVRGGHLTIKNCKIVGEGKSSIHQGIIVLDGSKLEMIDCVVSGFFTTIVGNSGSTISLTNCEISNANIGLKLYEKSNLKVELSRFANCKDYGVCIETNNDLDNGTNQMGTFSLLQA